MRLRQGNLDPSPPSPPRSGFSAKRRSSLPLRLAARRQEGTARASLVRDFFAKMIPLCPEVEKRARPTTDRPLGRMVHFYAQSAPLCASTTRPQPISMPLSVLGQTDPHLPPLQLPASPIVHPAPVAQRMSSGTLSLDPGRGIDLVSGAYERTPLGRTAGLSSSHFQLPCNALRPASPSCYACTVSLQGHRLLSTMI